MRVFLYRPHLFQNKWNQVNTLCEKDFFRDKALDFQVHPLQAVSHSVISYFFRDGPIFWVFNRNKRNNATVLSSCAWDHSRKNLDHLSLLHLFRKGGKQWRGEGKDWGERTGWEAAATLISKISWWPQSGWIGALAASLAGLGQRWWWSVYSLWRVPFSVG